MRSYNQYCGLAKALDAIGDRWALLIVRELLIRGRCRYTDLKNGLPGIASNMLAARLGDLESADVIRREESPPPVATTLFELTPRGQELEVIVQQLGRWGAPRLESTTKTDAFLSHWMVLPARRHLSDHMPKRPPEVIELRTGDEPVVVEVAKGSVQVRAGAVRTPNAVVTGSPRLVLAVLKGDIDLAQARSKGLQYKGDPQTLRRVQPLAVKRRVPV